MSFQIPNTGGGGTPGPAGATGATGATGAAGATGPAGSGLDPSFVAGSYFLKGIDNTAGGAGAAANLAIDASQKTSGTGDGGNLILSGGNSVGGSNGVVRLRIGGISTLGMNLAYAGGQGALQATANGTSTNPSYSWVNSTNSGMSYAGGSGVVLSYGGVIVFYGGTNGGESALQLGTTNGTLYAGINTGGLGYFTTTLVPFNKAYFGNGVVGIGVTSGATSQYSANALLDVQSTTKGVLFPRMTTAQKNAVTASEGMIVYDLTLHKLAVYTGSAWETVTSI